VPRYWGLDLHKRYVHACEWVTATQKERHFRFPNTPEGWAQFAAGELGPDCWVAIEVTGSAFEVHDWLSPRVGRVLLANPVELKRLGSGRHTDRVDAARLAKMLAMGILPTVWVPPPAVREVRRLLRYRHSLQVSRTRAYNQARAVLRRHGIHLPSRAELPEQLTEAHWRALPGGDRVILASAVAQVVRLGQELAALDAEILRRVASYPEVGRLLTITGVGPITAATLWAFIGDAARFPNAKCLARYAGLDPSVHQSGESHYQGAISRNGNGLLRACLVEAAHVVARFDAGGLGAFFRRKLPQLGYKRAVVALARKLLVVAWRLMLRGDTYRAARMKTVRNKRWALQKLQEQALDWEARIRRLLAIGVEESASRDRTKVPA